jgi:hypothetical protein
MGRCQGCNAEGLGDGYCHSCIMSRNHQQMIENARRMNQELHYAIYHDLGCCGCNKWRRRYFFLLLAITFAVLGLVFLVIRRDNTNEYASFFILAIIWFVVAITCPNGLCGEYSVDKTWGCLSCQELTAGLECCCPCCIKRKLQGGGLLNASGNSA